MGWERKRGKIEEFNRLLRGATNTSFGAPRRRHVDPAGGALLHHARQRYAPAARCRAPADRHHHAPAQSPDLRSEGRARHRRLRHPAAADQRHLHERGGIVVLAPLFGPHRRRSLHHRGVRHLPGPVQRRHLHGQGPLRRRCVHDRARGRRAREHPAVARPVRRAPRARGAGVGRGVRGRVPVERARALAAAAPVDPRRLADPRLALPLRAVAPRGQAQPAADDRALEDPRQPAAQPRLADVAADAGRCAGPWCPARAGTG